MFYEFPHDEQSFALTTQFMWGDAFLVSPKLQPSLYCQIEFLPINDDSPLLPIDSEACVQPYLYDYDIENYYRPFYPIEVFLPSAP
jgi:hypothetical protein